MFSWQLSNCDIYAAPTWNTRKCCSLKCYFMCMFLKKGHCRWEHKINFHLILCKQLQILPKFSSFSYEFSYLYFKGLRTSSVRQWNFKVSSWKSFLHITENSMRSLLLLLFVYWIMKKELQKQNFHLPFIQNLLWKQIIFLEQAWSQVYREHCNKLRAPTFHVWVESRLLPHCLHLWALAIRDMQRK